jgi:hypothetical protein
LSSILVFLYSQPKPSEATKRSREENDRARRRKGKIKTGSPTRREEGRRTEKSKERRGKNQPGQAILNKFPARNSGWHRETGESKHMAASPNVK